MATSLPHGTPLGPGVEAAHVVEGRRCSFGLVADLMRELGLRAVQPCAYKTTTVHGVEPVRPG